MLIVKLFIYALQLLYTLVTKSLPVPCEDNLIPIKANISNRPNNEMVRSEYTKKAFSNDQIFGD